MFLGIDIGGMSIKCGLLSDSGEILAKKSIKTFLGDYHVTIAQIAALCRETAQAGGVSFDDIIAVGTGVPGTVNRGYVSFAANLGWYGVPYCQELSKLLDKPCYAGNDANCALLGEWRFGAARGCKDVMAITLGTGIGTAFICNGQMILGNGSAGTEGGHIKIKERGKKCGCGRCDCWELYASTSSLLERTSALAEAEPNGITATLLNKEGLSGYIIFKAERAGDTSATKVINEYISDICVGLINYTNIFRPEKIIVGGGISQEPRIITPIEDLINAEAYGGKNNPYVTISTPAFFNDAGIIGAAALAMNG